MKSLLADDEREKSRTDKTDEAARGRLLMARLDFLFTARARKLLTPERFARSLSRELARARFDAERDECEARR